MRAPRDMEPLEDQQQTDAAGNPKQEAPNNRQPAKRAFDKTQTKDREGQGETSPARGGTVTKVQRDQTGQLVVQMEGRDAPVVDARVARCFPWSLPDVYISIRDKEGKELALLETLDELDPSSRQVVQQELGEKVFNPKIRRITGYKYEFGVASITADTDRGEVTFQIRSRDDVRLLSDTRALFRDADGNTYELADLDQLDHAGQKWLETYF